MVFDPIIFILNDVGEKYTVFFALLDLPVKEAAAREST
jgi:hypothetical protein